MEGIENRPSPLRRQLMAFGLAGAALLGAGAISVFAASPTPSTASDPAATQPADEGSGTGSGSGSTSTERSGHDCPKNGADDGASDTTSL